MNGLFFEFCISLLLNETLSATQIILNEWCCIVYCWGHLRSKEVEWIWEKV